MDTPHFYHSRDNKEVIISQNDVEVKITSRDAAELINELLTAFGYEPLEEYFQNYDISQSITVVLMSGSYSQKPDLCITIRKL